MRERATTIVGELLDAAAGHDEIDAVRDYAWPLPVRVISTMLGVPASDVPALAELSRASVDALEPFLDEETRALLDKRRDR